MRWIIRAIMALGLVIIVMVGLLFFIPTERIAALATDQFEQATGRTLDIAGDIRPTIFPSIGVRADAITVGNPDWVTEGPMLTADRLDVGVDLMGLLSGNIRVKRLEIRQPAILLVADGARQSWAFSDASAAAGTTAPADDGGSNTNPLDGIVLDLAEISDGTLRYVDRATGQETRVDRVAVTARLPEGDGQASVEARAGLHGTDLTVQATVEALGALLGGEVRPVSVVASWDGGEASLDGRLGLSPLGAQGQVHVDASDLGPILALSGGPVTPLPHGLGQDHLTADADLTLASEGSLHIRGLTLTADDNTLSGDIDIFTDGERPRVRASIATGQLDLTGLTGGTAEASASAPANAGWPVDPIDASALGLVDAQLAINIEGVDTGSGRLGNTDMTVSLDAGRAVIGLAQAQAYGGALSGEIILNARNGFSTRVDLSAQSVQLGPLLQEFANFDRLEGTGNVQLALLGVGNSVNALMHSWDGDGSITFGQGAILGLDLGGMLRTMDMSYRGEGARTVYDRIAGTFTVASGVVQNDDFVLEAPFGTVSGAGRVGLGEQSLDYTITPSVLAGQTQQGLSVPIRVHGPWANLSYTPDVGALADQNLGDQVDQIRQQAVEGLTRGAENALGVTVQEGQSVEDTLQQRLRSEAETQLQRLLGGN